MSLRALLFRARLLALPVVRLLPWPFDWRFPHDPREPIVISEELLQDSAVDLASIISAALRDGPDAS